jgi:predicted Zn-dependent protease with MMP-like domain
MINVEREKFEEMVSEGIRAIPEKFLRKLDNVVIVVEPEPTLAQSKRLDIHPGFSLFGLYEGIPQIRRGHNYSALPDKITIFQTPMEMAAQDEADIREMAKNTVWHEIAHHFGMDEKEVRAAEKARRQTL